MTRRFLSVTILLVLLGYTHAAHAQDNDVHTTSLIAVTDQSSSSSSTTNDELFSQALNDLMNIKVTSTTKTAKSFHKVPASIYVVTSEDIRRSGAQTIPEALRLVPGVDVAQLNSGQYAVSIRGFNSVFSDNLLVLVDGRTIYNNLFGGVYWEDQQMPMSDIDRIEVIRGPGTAIWGANAVQGIINIITKTAKDTQGVLATAEYGDGVDRDQQVVRYGGAFGKGSYYRVFGMSTDLSDGLNGDGSRTRDAWIDRNAGFRLDQGEEDSGKLLVTGNIYNNVNNAATEGETTSPPYIDSINTNFPDSGWNLMGHWEKMGSDGSTVSAEVDDDSSVHFVLPYAKADSDATNIDVQDSLAKMGQHSIIVGAGYRNETTAAGGLYLLGTQSFTNDELTLSGFIQDQIAFSKSLTAQIGSKFEHENFTGWEYEPSIHLGYSPDDQHTLWASASRAVRIPTLADLGFQVNAGAQFVEGGTLLTEFLTSSTIKDSEIVTAYEAGYRAQVTNDVLFDFSTYYNQYSQLIGVGNVGNPSFSPGPPPGLVAFVTPTDLGGGHTYGGEAVSHVTLTPTWRINLGYSYLNGETPDSLFDSQLNAPQNQFEVQSYQNLTKTLDFDSAVYFVEAVPQLAVGSYTKLDLRLGLQATKRCSISVGGNNLLQNHYYQFGTVIGGSTFEVQREFYTKVEWKF